MIITITAPFVTCSKCGASAPLQPQTLQLTGARSRQILRTEKPEGFSALDDGGNAWQVLAAERPRGWLVDGAGKALNSGLCPKCAKEDPAYVSPTAPPAPATTTVPIVPPVVTSGAPGIIKQAVQVSMPVFTAPVQTPKARTIIAAPPASPVMQSCASKLMSVPTIQRNMGKMTATPEAAISDVLAPAPITQNIPNKAIPTPTVQTNAGILVSAAPLPVYTAAENVRTNNITASPSAPLPIYSPTVAKVSLRNTSTIPVQAVVVNPSTITQTPSCLVSTPCSPPPVLAPPTEDLPTQAPAIVVASAVPAAVQITKSAGIV